MAKTEKNTVFARPNLKAFLLAAVLLLVVQHLISSAQMPSFARPMNVQARELSESEVQEMIWRANENPTYDAFLQISNYYEKRGDFKRALQFFRRAEKFGHEAATE